MVLTPSSKEQAPRHEQGFVSKEDGLAGGGCHVESLPARIFYHLFNILLALLVMIAFSPVFLLLIIVMKCRRHGSIFYRGVRLGLNRREFIMYKFRTLPEGAQQIIGSELLSSKHRMLTPFTRLLRDSRLDELPQLLNVLKRDMDFIGPRPVRPEVYENKCKQIKNYELRFSVRPGLIGYSQLFTPHGSPVRLRSYIDNRFVLRQRNLTWELRAIFFTAFALCHNSWKKSVAICTSIFKIKLFGLYAEKRMLERVQPASAFVYFEGLGVDADHFPIIDINDAFLKVYIEQSLPENKEFAIRLVCERGVRLKRKQAHCRARVYKSLPAASAVDKNVYLIEFEAVSELNQYLIDQYFLQKSIA